VRLELTERVTEPGFWLPIAALTEGLRGLWTVYALVPANPSAEPGEDSVRLVEPRAVEILHTEADRVFARGTLADGDRIVAGGLHRLARGQRVRIAETVAPAGAPLDQPELVLR
jgi:multidrug efflux pump subunit AcrA (membrane-fusion protein)